MGMIYRYASLVLLHTRVMATSDKAMAKAPTIKDRKILTNIKLNRQAVIQVLESRSPTVHK